MSRGMIMNLTREQVVDRGFSQVSAIPNPPKGKGDRPINYRLLAGYNGGFDPMAPHCASWSFGGRTPTADCIGFVLWASGIDRCQPGYKGTRGEWLNCTSLMDDALAFRKFCRLLKKDETELPGDWLLTRDHIGLVVRPACPAVDIDTLVLDCSPRHGRPTAINTGFPWSEACVVVRPTFYKESK